MGVLDGCADVKGRMLELAIWAAQISDLRLESPEAMWLIFQGCRCGSKYSVLCRPSYSVTYTYDNGLLFL